MTRKKNILIWSLSGALLAGGVVGTTLLVLKLIADHNIDLGPASYYKGKDKGTAKFNFKWYANSEGKQFMTDKEYQKLDEYLSTHLYYGPESDSLKEIVFGDRNVMGEGASGLYFGSTRQIFINIEEYVGSKNLTYADKQDAVNEVIAHEYGHHFAHIYLKGYKSTNSIWKSKLTYGPDGSTTVWNKQYLDAWERINHYTGQYSTDTSPFHSIKKYGAKVKSDYVNINNSISLNQLYNMANSKDHANPFLLPKNIKQKFYWGFPDIKPASSSGSIIQPIGHTPIIPLISDSKNVSSQEYMYSSDEQFTRQTEMMMWPKNYFNSVGSILNYDAKYSIPFKKFGTAAPLWSSQAYDLAHVKMDSSLSSWNAFGNTWYASPRLIYPNYPFGGNLDNNSIGGSTHVASYASDYYKFLINTMGYGSNISHIYTKNTKEIVRKRGNLVAINGQSSNKDMVKLSGYTTKRWNNITVMKNGSPVKTISLISNKYNNDGKSSLFHYFGRGSMNTAFNPNINKGVNPYNNWSQSNGRSEWKTPRTSMYTYIMKDFTNINDFKGSGYQLVLNNGNPSTGKILNSSSITNFSGHKDLTTFEEYMPENKSYWRVYFSNNQLVIEKNY